MEDLSKKEQWVLPLDNTVVFPNMKTKIGITDHESVTIKTLIDAGNNNIIGLSLKHEAEEGKYQESDFYNIGTLLKIDSLQNSDEGSVIYVRGVKRVKIDQLFLKDYDYSAKFSETAVTDDLDQLNEENIILFVKKIHKRIKLSFSRNRCLCKIN